MNKSDLVAAMAEKASLSKKVAEAAFNLSLIHIQMCIRDRFGACGTDSVGACVPGRKGKFV